MAETESNEVVVVDQAEVNYLECVAAEQGVEIERLPIRGFEPITIVTLSLTGTPLAVSTVVYLLDRRKGGQVVDLRPGAPKTVYRSTDVTYGLVVIIAADGATKVDVREPKGMFGHVSELIVSLVGELVGKGTEEVADVVGSHARDIATVTTDTSLQ